MHSHTYKHTATHKLKHAHVYLLTLIHKLMHSATHMDSHIDTQMDTHSLTHFSGSSLIALAAPVGTGEASSSAPWVLKRPRKVWLAQSFLGGDTTPLLILTAWEGGVRVWGAAGPPTGPPHSQANHLSGAWRTGS